MGTPGCLWQTQPGISWNFGENLPGEVSKHRGKKRKKIPFIFHLPLPSVCPGRFPSFQELWLGESQSSFSKESWRQVPRTQEFLGCWTLSLSQPHIPCVQSEILIPKLLPGSILKLLFQGILERGRAGAAPLGTNP